MDQKIYSSPRVSRDQPAEPNIDSFTCRTLEQAQNSSSSGHLAGSRPQNIQQRLLSSRKAAASKRAQRLLSGANMQRNEAASNSQNSIFLANRNTAYPMAEAGARAVSSPRQGVAKTSAFAQKLRINQQIVSSPNLNGDGPINSLGSPLGNKSFNASANQINRAKQEVLPPLTSIKTVQKTYLQRRQNDQNLQAVKKGTLLHNASSRVDTRIRKNMRPSQQSVGSNESSQAHIVNEVQRPSRRAARHTRNHDSATFNSQQPVRSERRFLSFKSSSFQGNRQNGESGSSTNVAGQGIMQQTLPSTGSTGSSKSSDSPDGTQAPTQTLYQMRNARPNLVTAGQSTRATRRFFPNGQANENIQNLITRQRGNQQSSKAQINTPKQVIPNKLASNFHIHRKTSVKRQRRAMGQQQQFTVTRSNVSSPNRPAIDMQQVIDQKALNYHVERTRVNSFHAQFRPNLPQAEGSQNGEIRSMKSVERSVIAQDTSNSDQTSLDYRQPSYFSNRFQSLSQDSQASNQPAINEIDYKNPVVDNSFKSGLLLDSTFQLNNNRPSILSYDFNNNINHSQEFTIPKPQVQKQQANNQASHNQKHLGIQRLRNKLYIQSKTSGGINYCDGEEVGRADTNGSNIPIEETIQQEPSLVKHANSQGSSNGAVDIHEIGAFSPYLLSDSNGTLQSTFTQYPPCDRSQVANRGFDPFSPQLVQGNKCNYSSLENSIQQVVPIQTQPTQMGQISKSYKRTGGNKLMEKSFVKKRSAAAQKFPPGFFVEGSFGSNQSRSPPRNRKSLEGVGQSSDMKSKQSGALEMARNLAVRNNTKQTLYATISPSKFKIDHAETENTRSTAQGSLKIKVQHTDAEAHANTSMTRTSKPSILQFSQRKCKIRLLSPTDNPNPIALDQQSLGSHNSNEYPIRPRGASMQDVTRKARNQNPDENMLDVNEMLPKNEQIPLISSAGVTIDKLKMMQLNLQQQNSNLQHQSAIEAQNRERQTFSPIRTRNLQNLQANLSSTRFKNAQMDGADDTFCDRVKKNIINNDKHRLQTQTVDDSEGNQALNQNWVAQGLVLQKEPFSEGSHLSTPKRRPLNHNHLGSGGKQFESADLMEDDPILRQSPSKPTTIDRSQHPPEAVHPQQLDQSLQAFLKNGQDQSPRMFKVRDSIEERLKLVSFGQSRASNASEKDIVPQTNEEARNAFNSTEQTLGQDGIMTFGNFATLLDNENQPMQHQ